MGAMSALVRMHLIDQHQRKTAIRSHADSEEMSELTRGKTLAEHFSRSKKNVWGLSEHPLTRQTDLVRLDDFRAALVGTPQTFSGGLRVALQPRCVFTAAGAPNERTSVRHLRPDHGARPPA